MKKGLFALVVLGAIAGTVAYKLKKNQEEKESLDEELEILSAVEEETEETEESDEESEEPDEIEELFEEVASGETVDEEFEEVDEEVREFDFSDKFDEVLEEIESHSVEEKISEEIVEETLNEENVDDYKIEFDSNTEEVIDENHDIFEDETPIQHTIDFKSFEDMDAYKVAVIEKGYVVTRGESPYQLSVLHIAPANKSELLVNVYYLANQAMKYNGSYQGWQSRKVL